MNNVTLNKCKTAATMMLSSIVAAFVAYAQENLPIKNHDVLRYGADFRLRQENMEDIQTPSSVLQDNYLRMRSRVWLEYDPVQDITLRVRAMNEFRHWFGPDQAGIADSTNFEFPDEIALDNLFLEIRDLMDNALVIRIGRQDFMVDGTDKPLYGRGRVIYDGTSEDGSRSRYFNAIRTTWTINKTTILDLFGVYLPPEDDLVTGSVDRDLTGYTGVTDDMTQTGGGAYLKNKSTARCPFEAYVIFKHENPWDQPAKKDSSGAWKSPSYAWQTLETERGQIGNSERDETTIGFLIEPIFGRRTKGSLELAYQFGERGNFETGSYMIDATLNQSLPCWQKAKPAIEAEFYCLSGDDAKTDRDEGWDPVWARYTQHSDLVCRNFSRCRWSNIMMPILYAYANPANKIKTTLGVSYVTAPENDGPGTGRNRGWWYFVKLDYDVAAKLFCNSDKLTSRILFELLEPGNYYQADDTAFFMQWQVIYKF